MSYNNHQSFLLSHWIFKAGDGLLQAGLDWAGLQAAPYAFSLPWTLGHDLFLVITEAQEGTLSDTSTHQASVCLMSANIPWLKPKVGRRERMLTVSWQIVYRERSKELRKIMQLPTRNKNILFLLIAFYVDTAVGALHT